MDLDYFQFNSSDYFNYSNPTEYLNYHQDIMSYAIVQTVLYILYTTIFVLGVFGNCLVCFVVFRKKNMRNVTNFFIVNLALADILLCVIAVPFTPIYFVMKRWVFGQVLCKLLPMAQGVSVYISSLTLTSIAVDRYFVILFPFRRRLAVRRCYCIIISIWLFSIIVTLPYGLYMDEVLLAGVLYCEEFWPSETIRRIFGGCTAAMQFLIPFVVILYCYVRISCRMNERAMSKPGSRSAQREEADRDKKKRMNRMLIAMVAIFACLWFPLNIVNLIGDYHVQAGTWKYFNMCFFITHCLAMSSTCYNPFLYAWLNDSFRKEFQMVLPCFKDVSDSLPRGQWCSERTCNGTSIRRSTRRGSPQSTTFTSSVKRPSKENIVTACSTSKSRNILSTVEEGLSGEPDDVFLLKPDKHPLTDVAEIQLTTFSVDNEILKMKNEDLQNTSHLMNGEKTDTF